VRTDATTEYFQWINSRWIIFNPLTNYFFVTDPGSNHVFVLDAASETEVGVISVPGAYSIDDSADHKTLWVATTLGDVYNIDPVLMTVTKRNAGSQIGPSGYYVASALVMADDASRSSVALAASP
jgi:DNA-binding beta-propeller fold protein YncE